MPIDGLSVPVTLIVPDQPPFCLGRTPVTNRQYAAFLESGRVAEPPWWNAPHFRAPEQPVVGVSWFDAMAYCAWLGEVAGGTWRLPSEEEWEFAACGGLLSPATAWGETVPPGEVPEGPLEGPWEAGRGTPNGYGLCDIGTIVHEWCLNWSEPPRPGPARRASRGGSWRHRIRWSAPSASSSLPPDYRYADYGFRVLRERDANDRSRERTHEGGTGPTRRGTIDYLPEAKRAT